MTSILNALPTIKVFRSVMQKYENKTLTAESSVSRASSISAQPHLLPRSSQQHTAPGKWKKWQQLCSGKSDSESWERTRPPPPPPPPPRPAPAPRCTRWRWTTSWGWTCWGRRQPWQGRPTSDRWIHLLERNISTCSHHWESEGLYFTFNWHLQNPMLVYIWTQDLLR